MTQLQIDRHNDVNALTLAEMMKMQWPATDRHDAAEAKSEQLGDDDANAMACNWQELYDGQPLVVQ